MNTESLYKLLEYTYLRALREFFHRLRKNFAFKLFSAGFIILLIFSVAIYYTEKSSIKYIYKDGQIAEDTCKSPNIRTLEESIWWAIATSTMAGYDDYYPVSRVGRVVGVLLMMFFGIS